VQVYVSRLRKAFDDPETLSTTPAGYCLRVRPDELDAERFARLVEDGRHALNTGQAEHAAAVLRDALALWRGPPLADLTFEPFAQAEIARLQEQRLAAFEERVEADLAAGQHATLVAELRQLVTANPTRERLAGQLMLALYRCGQQADALETYHAARRVLAEIGLEPGLELRRLQEAILHQDLALEPRGGRSELPQELDASTEPPLVGRDAELTWLRERWERARTGSGALVTVTGIRGIGKSRVMAELARDAHRLGATVLYADGARSAEEVFVALDRAQEAANPTLLAVDDADQAAVDVLAQIVKLTRVLPTIPVLALVSGEDAKALARLGADDSLTLLPLAVDAVRTITIRYAPGRAAEEVPVDWLLQASGGIPGRVHEVAAQWARREAVRRVGAVAGRAAAGRSELRSMESELADDIVAFQATRERIVLGDVREALVVCPFKGLASFELADAPYFFGRERLVAELVARLVGAPLLGVVGPSGSGKSSVLRAGVLPALAGGVLPGSARWTQVLIRPGQHPLRELSDAASGLEGDRRHVVAVDQFEETFTACRDEQERAAFIAELARMAQLSDARCIVVLAIRADYYGRCAAYSEFASLLAPNHVLVGPMSRDELFRVVQCPAQRVGLSVEPALADALVADVEDELGGLPLLSAALLELWQRREGRHLRHAAYQHTGGVRGAVARLAEEAFSQLDPSEQIAARTVLMRLVAAGGDICSGGPPS
jgi:DNA-binding SARP family transcriptional activator